jgi:hypothetical protein
MIAVRPQLFDSRNVSPTITKFWFPLLAVGGAISIAAMPRHAAAPGAIWLLPILAAIPSAIMFSARMIYPSEASLEYCWLRQWRAFDYDRIVDIKRAWIPMVGVMRLRDRVPPFGRMYFVLSGDYSATEAMIAYIRERIAGNQPALAPVSVVAGTGVRHPSLLVVGIAIWPAFLVFQLASLDSPSAASFLPQYVNALLPAVQWLGQPLTAAAVIPIAALGVFCRHRIVLSFSAALLGATLGAVVGILVR